MRLYTPKSGLQIYVIVSALAKACIIFIAFTWPADLDYFVEDEEYALPKLLFEKSGPLFLEMTVEATPGRSREGQWPVDKS